jgi:hypothetical protein
MVVVPWKRRGRASTDKHGQKMNGSTQSLPPLTSREQLESTEMKLNKKRPKVLKTTSPRSERSIDPAAVRPIESQTRFSPADLNEWEEIHGDAPMV